MMNQREPLDFFINFFHKKIQLQIKRYLLQRADIF